ncbi:MAG: DUF1444 family protein [Rhodocyclaceae bacterium]|nr:DUF1444 family protein [Rhodocyclaceae bacterium]
MNLEDFLNGAIACIKVSESFAVDEMPATDGSATAVRLPPDQQPVVRDLGNGLLAVYLTDTGDHLAVVQNHHLQSAGASADQLHRVAVANLRRLAAERVRVTGFGTFYEVVLDGQFEASLLLVDAFWEESAAHLVPNGAVAALPTRDVLAFCDADSRDGIEQLQALIDRLGPDVEHRLTDTLYHRQNGCWQPFVATPAAGADAAEVAPERYSRGEAPCPKCGYLREPYDDAPDWQCPSCKSAYAKAGRRGDAEPVAAPSSVMAANEADAADRDDHAVDEEGLRRGPAISAHLATLRRIFAALAGGILAIGVLAALFLVAAPFGRQYDAAEDATVVAQHPVVATIGRLSEADHETLMRFLNHRTEQGVDGRRALLFARPLLAHLATRLLPRADDAAVLAWGRQTVDALERLSAVDSEQCLRASMTKPVEDAAVLEAFADEDPRPFHDAVIKVYQSAFRGTVERPAADLDIAGRLVQAEYRAIERELSQSFDEPVLARLRENRLLDVAATTRDQLCAARIAQLNAILARPPELAAQLLADTLH